MLRAALVILVLVSAVSVVSPAWADRPPVPEAAELLDRGNDLLRQGQLAEARQLFQKAVEVDPQCYQGFNNIGLTYYRAGDLENAGEAYKKALKLEPAFGPSVTNLGTVRHQQKRLQEATNLYRLALRISDGKDYEIHYNLANVLRDRKDFEMAKKHYQESIKLKDNFPPSHNGLGATYICLKNLKEAEQEIRAAIALKHDYSLAYYHLALIEQARKNYPAAVSNFKESLKYEERPDYKRDTQDKVARLEKLITEQKAAQLAGNQDNGPPLLASASPANEPETKKSLGGALKKFENLLSTGSDDPVIWNNYGLLQLRLGSYKEAVKALLKATELGKGDLYQAHYNLAQAYKALSDQNRCESECKKAIDSASRNGKVCPLAHNLLAIVLKQKNQLAKADQEYKLAIAQSMGKYPVLHYNHGILLEKLNKPKEAKAEYLAYINAAPTGVNVMKAKLRLGLLSMSL